MSPLPANSQRSRAPIPHWPKLTGCVLYELVQGYLLSKPLPKADLLRLLAAGNPMAKARATTP